MNSRSVGCDFWRTKLSSNDPLLAPLQALIAGHGAQSLSVTEVKSLCEGLSVLLAGKSTVLVQLPPSMHSLVLLLAMMQAGRQVVWLDAAAGQAAWERLLIRIQPQALVCATEVFGQASKAAFLQGMEPVYTLGLNGEGSLLDRAHSARLLQAAPAVQSGGSLEVWGDAQAPQWVWGADQAEGCQDWLRAEWSSVVSGPLWDALLAEAV